MLNLSLKDFLICVGIVVVLCTGTFAIAKLVAFKSEIKRNQAQIDTLQAKLSKCNAVSNNINIGKIKGKASTDIHQLLVPNRRDTLYYMRGYCDTIGIIAWYWRQDRKDRLFYERLGK